MTTTYDPHHPLYLDDADLREELTRVYDVCGGCRLCVRFCSAFPTLFALIDRHDARAAELTRAEQDQVVEECFQCKLCYVNCPYTPGRSDRAIDFPRLMLRANATRHANGETGRREALTSNLLARTDLMGKLGTRMASVANSLTARPGVYGQLT